MGVGVHWASTLASTSELASMAAADWGSWASSIFAACSSAPGNRCPYMSLVIAKPEWPARADATLWEPPGTGFGVGGRAVNVGSVKGASAPSAEC
jgi:hypothetical protein